MLRIAPRIKYKSEKLVLGFEFEYTSVQYAEQGGINEYGKVTDYYTVENLKPILSLKYLF